MTRRTDRFWFHLLMFGFAGVSTGLELAFGWNATAVILWCLFAGMLAVAAMLREAKRHEIAYPSYGAAEPEKPEDTTDPNLQTVPNSDIPTQPEAPASMPSFPMLPTGVPAMPVGVITNSLITDDQARLSA